MFAFGPSHAPINTLYVRQQWLEWLKIRLLAQSQNWWFIITELDMTFSPTDGEQLRKHIVERQGKRLGFERIKGGGKEDYPVEHFLHTCQLCQNRRTDKSVPPCVWLSPIIICFRSVGHVHASNQVTYTVYMEWVDSIVSLILISNQYECFLMYNRSPANPVYLSKCTDFQLVAMSKSNKSTWNSSTQQMLPRIQVKM